MCGNGDKNASCCNEGFCLIIVDFTDSLSVVSEAVNQAEFLAVDAEFSGFVYLIVV